MGEAELIKQCMRGVNAARKELYDTYAEQMLSICFRYTGGMDVAYDLLHDGFFPDSGCPLHPTDGTCRRLYAVRLDQHCRDHRRLLLLAGTPDTRRWAGKIHEC